MKAVLATSLFKPSVFKHFATHSTQDALEGRGVALFRATGRLGLALFAALILAACNPLSPTALFPGTLTQTQQQTLTTAPVPTLSLANANGLTLSVGGTGSNIATSNYSPAEGNGAITYKSGNSAVATVDSSSGVVTGQAVGTATITVEQAAKTGVHAAATTSYTVTVSPLLPNLIFSNGNSQSVVYGAAPKTAVATCAASDGSKAYSGRRLMRAAIPPWRRLT